MANTYIHNMDTVESSSETSTKKIETVIRFHIRMMINQFDEVFVVNHEWKHLKEPFLSTFLTQRRHYEKRLISLVESGILKNEFKTTNPYITVLMILSAVRGLEFWQRHKRNVPSQVVEDDIVGLLLNGILK
jgi:hypothetical protein